MLGTILYGPPKPPRTAQGLERAAMNAVNLNLERNIERNPLTERMNKAEIRTALQNWQKGLLLNDQDPGKSVIMGYNAGNGLTRSSGDGKSSGQLYYCHYCYTCFKYYITFCNN